VLSIEKESERERERERERLKRERDSREREGEYYVPNLYRPIRKYKKILEKYRVREK
jgi:hypothetical protein